MERAESNDRPTTTQMWRLASLSPMASQGSFEFDGQPGEYFVSDNPYPTLMNETDAALFGPESTTSVYLGRINAGFETPIWRLHSIDVEVAQSQNGDRHKLKLEHEFEWSDQQVYFAKRSVSTFSSVLEPSFDTLTHGLSDKDTVAMLTLESDFSKVTRADCDLLIGSMSNYFERVKNVQRAR